MVKQPRSQEIGHKIKHLEKGQRVQTSNKHMDKSIIGTVTEKNSEENGFHEAIIHDPDGNEYRLHVNWRDIREDEPNKTPYTGLIEYEKNDTAPPVTELKIIS